MVIDDLTWIYVTLSKNLTHRWTHLTEEMLPHLCYPGCYLITPCSYPVVIKDAAAHMDGLEVLVDYKNP